MNKDELKIIAIKFEKLNSIVRLLIITDAFGIDINNLNIRLII